MDDILISTAPCGGGVPNLTISDVSAAEGNAGTTAFNFIASPPRRLTTNTVTFTAATIDGSATTAVQRLRRPLPTTSFHVPARQ